MNGEVNGTMEEHSETSLPDSQVKQVEDIIEKCLSPKDNNSSVILEPKDNLGTESDQESHSKNVLKNDSPENDKDLQTPNCNTETVAVPIQENSPNDVNNHCTNSNESRPESENSSHGNSENLEEQSISSIKEKCETRELTSNCLETVTIEDMETHDIDSEGSSDEDGSILSGDLGAKETVTINTDSSSDDDSSEDGQTKDKSNDIIILENDNRPDSQNGISRVSGSPEVHEIASDNDDCILANDEKFNPAEKQQLRRSRRSIKRKHYDIEENGDDESDVEEVEMQDPLSGRSKPIIINDTKTLVEMAAKKMKLNQNNQKKEPTIVIIDTTSGKGHSSQTKCVTTNSSINAQSLYQSIVARGTTVTPVSTKTNSSTQMSPTSPQALILPSLTDDMFVVEAPSFIVPYVYEKPSVEPFREFVDKLGKELEEQKAKEEKERLEKELEKKQARDKLRKERKERGEVVSESEDETKKAELEEAKKKKKAEKKEKRRRKNDDGESSWDGEDSSDSDEETLSDDDVMAVKEKDNTIDEFNTIPQLTANKVCNGKSDNYFDCSLGKFFVNIGLSLVQEYVQSDLLKTQNRKLSREKKSGHNTKETQSAITSLMKNLKFSKENNAPFSFPQTKCEFCSFKTESKLVLNHHLETPHMKNNVYKCNFCEYEVRSPHEILSHMEIIHRVRGKLERAPAYHQCCNCPFEDNGKGKLARHQITCAKKFKPEHNLAPPIEWEPPAKIPKIARARSNTVGSFQSAFNRQVNNSMMRSPLGVGGGLGGGYRPRGRSPLALGARAAVHGVPIMRAAALTRHNTPAVMPNAYPIANNGKSKSHNNLSISITPLPRQPQPVATQPISQSKNTFVICEICDGYIKDLEQLRNHMQWIHKVKIHPKMIYNRPPLNCQKCQFRFFTDQGLERHLLGSHGLVTSSMQEAANKGKDAGRCPVCGRVYQWKLLNHVAKDHNLTLKPAHLSYKCTVCTATFGMYKQFENHVYSAHSVVAKRVMDKGKSTAPAAKSSDSLLKPLKINDEITIIPQPVKAATSTKTK